MPVAAEEQEAEEKAVSWDPRPDTPEWLCRYPTTKPMTWEQRTLFSVKRSPIVRQDKLEFFLVGDLWRGLTDKNYMNEIVHHTKLTLLKKGISRDLYLAKTLREAEEEFWTES